MQDIKIKIISCDEITSLSSLWSDHEQNIRPLQFHAMMQDVEALEVCWEQLSAITSPKKIISK